MKSNTKRAGWQDGDEPEGRYANYFKVGHNPLEFVLDFGQFYLDDEKVKLHTRIVTNPVYARALLEIIQSSVECYEESFGVIPKETEDEE